MKTSSIEPFFATLQAANPHPVTELEYTMRSSCWPPCCSRRKPPTWASQATRHLLRGQHTPENLALGSRVAGYIRTSPVPHQGKEPIEPAASDRTHGGHVRTSANAGSAAGRGPQDGHVVLTWYSRKRPFRDTHIFRAATHRAGTARTPRSGWAAQARAVRVHAACAPLADPHGRYVCQARRPLCERAGRAIAIQRRQNCWGNLPPRRNRLASFRNGAGVRANPSRPRARNARR